MDENQANRIPPDGEIEDAQTLSNANEPVKESYAAGNTAETRQVEEAPIKKSRTDSPSPSLEQPESVQPVKNRDNSLTKWLQFPRRILFLLLSGGIAVGILIVLQRVTDYQLTRSELNQNMEQLWFTLPNTLLLLCSVLLVAVLLASVATTVAVLIHMLEGRAGWPARVLKGLGRLSVFSITGLPTFTAGMLLLFFFAIQLKILPASGLYRPQADRTFWDMLLHLILPVTALAFYPATLAAQAAAREMTLPRPTASPKAILAGIFKGLGVLLQQTGGLLSAILVGEAVFSFPGIGRWMLQALLTIRPDVLFRASFAMIAVILLGKILAEAMFWIGRLVNESALISQESASRSQKSARLIWLIFCLLLLATPIFITIRAGVIPEHLAVDTNLSERSQPPSELHPWGTDQLGRDILARSWRGTRQTLWMSIMVAGMLLLPALVGGGIFAFLHSLKRFWAESLADFLLVPLDSFLFLPTLPLFMILLNLVNLNHIEYSNELIIIMAGTLILPRTMRVFQSLWEPVYRFKPAFLRVLPALGSMIFSFIYSGFALVLSIDALGLGVNVITPSIGNVLLDAFQIGMIRQNYPLVIGSSRLVFACLFPLFLSADAFAGYFSSKESMAHLNE